MSMYKLGQCVGFTLVGLIFGALFTGVGFVLVYAGVSKTYCDSIIVDCNVSRTGYVYTWSPKDSAIVCSYAGETFVKDNDWDIIDCYYDDEVNKCPSDECEKPERINKTRDIGIGLLLGAVGMIVTGGTGMLIYMLVDEGIKKCIRGRNNTNGSSSDVTVNSYGTSSSDTSASSSDGRCDITVDSYSDDNSSSNDRHFYDSS